MAQSATLGSDRDRSLDPGLRSLTRWRQTHARPAAHYGAMESAFPSGQAHPAIPLERPVIRYCQMLHFSALPLIAFDGDGNSASGFAMVQRRVMSNILFAVAPDARPSAGHYSAMESAFPSSRGPSRSSKHRLALDGYLRSGYRPLCRAHRLHHPH